MLDSLIVTFSRYLGIQFIMFPKWSYEIWIMSSLMFVLWPSICDGRFAVDKAYLFAPMVLPFMSVLPLQISASFWDCCAFIKPVIVYATTDYFSVMTPTALVLLFFFCASVIFLYIAYFLSFICCISWLSQRDRFAHFFLWRIYLDY